MPHIPYEKYAGLIGHTITKFHKVYKGDYEEIHCRANYWFCVAWHSYDARKGEFAQWISNTIWHRLLDERDRDRRYQNLIKRITPQRAMPTGDSSGFDLEEFSKSLSSRGRIVLELVLTPPPLAIEFIRDRGEPNQENVKEGLRDFLIHQGWYEVWIQRAFAEIRKGLKQRRYVH